jgi:hypothetical protein
MAVRRFWVKQEVALYLIACLTVPFCSAQTGRDQGQQTAGASQVQSAPAAPAATSGNDSVSSSAAQAQSTGEQQQTPTPQTTTTPPQTPTVPNGTAAAPYEKQEGTSASRPAGSAIAPGKQRRIRSFAVRVGLLVGAAVAIGVVAGASLGSSGRP